MRKIAGKKLKKGPKTTTTINLVCDVPSENYFFVCDGHALKNVLELRDKIKNIDEHTFRHHVNESKNDFSNWINDVIKDKKLADDIKKATSPQEILVIIEKRLSKIIPKKSLCNILVKK